MSNDSRERFFRVVQAPRHGGTRPSGRLWCPAADVYRTAHGPNPERVPIDAQCSGLVPLTDEAPPYAQVEPSPMTPRHQSHRLTTAGW